MSKSKPNSSTMKPKPPSLTTLTNSIMSQNQLIDDLTAHISLYHSQSLSSSNPNNTSTTSNHRSNIIKWFSSLAVHQRQAYLTTVDHNFLNLLVQMLSKLRKHGHGRFIILPDLPSRGGLPGLCFKKLSGLLFRVAESNESERLVFESVLLFGSREGERENDCLDSLTVREEFVENVSEFVEVMDKVSNGGFLRGEDSELGSDWVELEWLKARGYYTMEAFVVNRLEVSLRLAWLNSCNGKKRGVKLKEKVAAASVAANVFWRKKGGVDWWRNLDDGTREKFFKTVLGKSAKLLTHEVLKNARNATEDEMWMFKTGAEQSLRYINADLSQMNLFKLSSADADFGLANKLASLCGKADSLSNACNSLFVLNDVVGLMSLSLYSGCDTTKVFFSTLGSVNTISDCILRKLRGFVMVISLDCTKLELLGEGNMKSLPNKQKGKSGSGTRRKKGKHGNMKRQSQIAHNIVEESSDEKPCKGLESTSISAEKIDLMETNGLPAVSHGTEIHKEIPTLTEHSKELVVGKGRMVSKKNKKGKTKNKSSRCKNPDEMRNPEGPVAPDAFLVFDSDEPAKLGEITDDLSIQSSPNNETLVTLASNASARSSADQTAGKDINAHTVEDRVVAAAEKMYHTGPENHKSPKNLSKKQAVPSSRNILNSNFPGSTASCRDSVEEIDKGSTNKDHQKVSSESDSTSKHARALDIKKESNQRPQLNTNFYSMRSTSPSEFVSYEWPSLTPVYFPSLNPHLPPATDRLHLDVGLNWQNHIRQPFVPNVHQARNSPIEAGCNGVLSRPPMSLDWPPMVRSICGLAPSLTCTYDSGFISRRKSVFGQSFTGQRMHLNAATDDEAKYSGEFMDMPDGTDGHEGMDEGDGCWIQEEDFELHSVSGIDYNQYFGGGVMYWNPSDYLGSGFSRPPSLSSDDSSWAWHEADMNRAVDDMVAFSSSYSTTGLTSPTAASFCSPFEALSYVVPGNEGSGKVLHPSSATTDAVTDDELTGPLANLSGDTEGKPGDSLAYPILRPIIIPNMSTSEIKRPNDITSPCVRASRREQPRIKRPPSPVVLCVPRAPRPPPPSPVSDSRKHRGFPTVRSGSSSPRHWGVKGWYNDATSMDEACVRVDGTEVFWPSWRNKNVPTCPIVQPLTGALLQDHLIAISQLSRDQEHPDVLFPLQPPEPESCPTRNASISLMHNLLHEEIDNFWKQVAAANMVRKPFISWAVKRVTRSLQVLWPRSRANVFGSNATGLSLPTSDVDLVVCLPPVRNLEPIKEAGILEGRNGIKETCLQHAARYLANQEWVKSDSLKTVENTAIPIIMLVVEVPNDFIAPVASIAQSPPDELMHRTCKQDHVPSDMVGLEDSTLSSQSENNNTNNNNQNNMKDVKSVRLDISFKSPSHTGLQTTELVKELTEQFPAVTPLALVLKKFLADRSLDQSYSGGLSSYCLVLLITRFLQHEHHLGRPINQNWGSLLMDFLYFFGNVFDPRQMRISVQGSGVYINRERGHSIDPIHIDDPLCPTNNVGRNCFRIHQCIKAFSEAYSILGSELANLPVEGEKRSRPLYTLLSKIIPSIHLSSQTRISEEVKPV